MVVFSAVFFVFQSNYYFRFNFNAKSLMGVLFMMWGSVMRENEVISIAGLIYDFGNECCYFSLEFQK